MSHLTVGETLGLCLESGLREAYQFKGFTKGGTGENLLCIADRNAAAHSDRDRMCRSIQQPGQQPTGSVDHEASRCILFAGSWGGRALS